MKPFETHTGVAVPMDEINVDTDQILPARFLRKRRLDPEYPSYLFHDLRFREDGSEIEDFPLNRAPYRDATILVGNTNFGGGSSREAAAFALDAYGIRCVIAPNVGDIFYGNCIKNGILPVQFDKPAVDDLRAALWKTPGAKITVDLSVQSITGPDGFATRFEMDEFDKHNLLLGLSQIGLTLRHDDEIAAFEARYRAEKTWL